MYVPLKKDLLFKTWTELENNSSINTYLIHKAEQFFRNDTDPYDKLQI